jgi:hypothetical protein
MRHVPKHLIFILVCSPYAINFIICTVSKFSCFYIHPFCPLCLSPFLSPVLSLSCLLYFHIIFLFTALRMRMHSNGKKSIPKFWRIYSFWAPLNMKKCLLLCCVSLSLYELYVCVYLCACVRAWVNAQAGRYILVCRWICGCAPRKGLKV